MNQIEHNLGRRITLIVALLLIVAAIGYFESLRSLRSPSTASSTPIAIVRVGKDIKASLYPPAEELVSPQGFINSKPFKLSEYVGKKVILLDFWTYSCINCQRTLPYLTQWWKKYEDKGLLIVGVHTPEFAFEREYENVRQAVRKFGIQYPVFQDNNFATWGAYNNHYWPAKYLIDIDGFVVYRHFGEGSYDETEAKIQDLLRERADALNLSVSVPEDIAQVSIGGVPMDPSRIKSPEIYFGSRRNILLGNGIPETAGIQALVLPEDLELNRLYLEGNWGFRDEFAHNTKAPAKIVFKYSAKDVYMVANSEFGVRVKVLRDGKPVGDTAGADVGKDGMVLIKEDRLYKLIQDPEAYGEHTLELIIENPGLRAFTFTFG